MQRSKLVVIVACFVVTAGCGGLGSLGGSSDAGDSTDTTTPTGGSTDTPTATSDDDTADQGPAFGPETNTDDIVLRLSDLSSDYAYSGETNRRTSELSGEEQAQYESQGIVRQHSRSFRRSSEAAGPVLVYSEATVYENAEDVDAQLEEAQSTFENQSAEVETIELASGVTATQISYENDRGAQSVLMYYERHNLLLLVISSGQEQFHPERAQELMIQMVSDIS